MKLPLLALLLIASTALAAMVTNPSQATLDNNDNQVLMLALTLENLDYAFFNMFQNIYTRTAFGAAGGGLSATVWDSLDLLRLQELAHAQLLNATLIARTGAGVPPCNYNFSIVTNIFQYIGLARVFENVGTAAYDGSISAIYNRTIQQAAATIATVEARHAAFLNQLPGNISLPVPFAMEQSPFPNATDYAFSAQTVQGLIAPFILNCPYNVAAVLPSIPVVIPVPAPNSGSPANPTSAQVTANDINALNFALTLEYLEATYYNTYLGQPGFDQTAFVNGGFTADDFNYFTMIRTHENIHVTFLQNAIKGLGGTPIANCTYNFATHVFNLTTFITTAQLLEGTGVTAYDGAVNTIFDTTLRQAAATVATVEARHAAFLNSLVNATAGSAFPIPEDTPVPPQTIVNEVSAGFITSCPTAPPIPVSYVITPYNGTVPDTTSTTAGSNPSSSTTRGSGSTSATTSGASIVAVLSTGFFMTLALFL